MTSEPRSPRQPTAWEGVQRDLEGRLCELETRLAHLGRFVEDLNDVVTDQATRIEHLERENAQLRNRLSGGSFPPAAAASGRESE